MRDVECELASERHGTVPVSLPAFLDPVHSAVASVPGAGGANNHMGSTTNVRAMRAVMARLNHHRLFFMDSITVPETVGYAAALELPEPEVRARLARELGYVTAKVGADAAIFDDDGRLMVAINFNMDMGDAWEHADDPYYPEPMTALAYRFGINYLIYAMTH